MRKLLLLLFLFTFLSNQAQVVISGQVFSSKDIPLEGAAVYLDNTSMGTTTDSEGYFELSVREGNHLMVVSYLGFEIVQYNLDTNKKPGKLIFKLAPKTNMLEEVVVSNKKKKISARDRAYFLQRFKSSFIGRTNLSRECKILNEKSIEFDFDDETGVLEASSRIPLEIENKGLGYKIFYDLVLFELTPEKVTYLGYSRYQNLKGSKRKKRKWRKARKIAYNGSRVHFVRSLREGLFSDEGFVIDQFKRVPNPNRPSDKEIDKARAFVRKMRLVVGNNVDVSRNFVINLGSPNNKRNRKIDSAMAIVRKSNLKKFNDVIVRKNLKTEDIIFNSPEGIKIRFDDFLKISYLNEKEEYSFRPGSVRLDYQVSKMTMLSSDKTAILDGSGLIIDPLDVFVEGYWGYEKVADKLPLDYYPNEK